ncbi:Oligopeptide transporter OPT superfamily protein [Musicola paradisiaca Ech703]|uniref:Oligopeptide transporter OPT superfamily protein n=1 Tax=Musicola paradisiaca (strain Ech703) TaxID=579405 RepID=C6C7F3_MUSP7|nr:Oligopeptide transporter OPT superfamily protein [Musicola paradisiaca Ech703]
MNQLSSSDVNAGSHTGAHPRAFAPGTLLLLLALSIFGAIVGVQLLTTLGVTPNTSIIGAMMAMIVARIPLQSMARFRSVHIQNLAQSATSAATFGAANSLLLPIAIPWLFGRQDLVMPMFFGVALAMLLDGYMLYRLFNTRIFPAEGAWPPGIAVAESIKAGDKGGRQAGLLGIGIAIGVFGAWLKFPIAALGTAFIGNIWALAMLGIGFLLRGYSLPLLGVDINQHYIPHGIMAGAGVVALFQIIKLMRNRDGGGSAVNQTQTQALSASQGEAIGKTMRLGAVGFIVISALIALGSGLFSQMSLPWILAFVLYAALAAFLHEVIVGLAAMHSGWFPAFAVALITLLIGILIGFPPEALVMLCGFSAATGPAFADMGYDLKAGFILRGRDSVSRFELEGRKQQLLAALLAFVVAIPVVFFIYREYFSAGLVPPVAKVYVAAIQAGVSPDIAKSLLLWAIPGALIQLIGGPGRQMGVLLATGLLINNPLAGWAVMIGILIRVVVLRVKGDAARNLMEVLAAGLIAGDALFSFFNSMLSPGRKK